MASDQKVFEATRNRRNAQEIATLCTIASGAGVHFGVPNDPVQSARNTVAGATATNGSFAGQTFRLPNLQESDIIAAAYFLEMHGTEVIYNGNRPNP